MAEINTWPGWRCVRLLGKGSFGKVYEIERVDNGIMRRSALKVMSFPMSPSDVQTGYIEGWYSDEMGARTFYESQINIFSREYRMMQAISNHENIVTFEDYMVVPHQGWVGADILIRMELLIPLSQWLMYNPVNDEVITKLGIDIASALETCQKLKPPILHRDIKLDNIMIDWNGNFKLGDFGVARFVEGTKSAHTVAGTESYMAPEVIMGKGYTVTADIYSLGIVLYRLLNNGRNPYLPADGPLTYDQQESAKVKRLQGVQMNSPKYGSERLKKIIRKCLEFNSSDRYKNATDLRTAFERVRDGKSDNDFGIKKSSTISGLKVTLFSILGVLAFLGVLFILVMCYACTI